MVPQSWQREKVNRLKIKIFLIGHIYEVKITRIEGAFGTLYTRGIRGSLCSLNCKFFSQTKLAKGKGQQI